jgi:shikimate dehydrogenase
MQKPDRYAVFGHPIGHSKSPRIHALFAEQARQHIHYTAQDVPGERFDAAVRSFVAAGGKGLNCTVPLKELAFRRADRRSDRAELSKAVNTLTVQADGALYGDNTDGVGLIQDVTLNLGIPLECKQILLLGAGGASRGIIGPLLAARPTKLVIANRTYEKAVQLSQEFSAYGPVSAFPLNQLARFSFDLVINATAASLLDQMPPLPDGILASGACCYDLAYGDKSTAFMLWGKRQNAARTVDGLGMLVEQAAEAFFIWRGVRPETRPVIDLLDAARHRK